MPSLPLTCSVREPLTCGRPLLASSLPRPAQLMLGNAFANGTGPPEYYPTASSLNPLKSWYVQAQYFFKLKCQYEARGVFGAMVPVEEGDVVTTRFTLDEANAWHLSIAAATSGGPARVSKVLVPYPFMNSSLSWADAPFATTGPGACWEVYGMDKATDYPAYMTYEIVTAAATRPVTPYPDWGLTEMPTCKQAPPMHDVSATTSKDGKTQEARLVIKTRKQAKDERAAGDMMTW